MKRNVLTIIYMLLLSCALSSCEDGCKGERLISQHLVDCYEEWSSFKLSYNGRFVIILIPENRYYSDEAQEFFRLTQTIENLNKYNELSAKNKDVGYEWTKIYLTGTPPRTAAHPGIADILITSDRDYDGSHPAETSLNDIFIADYQSYTQFLGNTNHSNVIYEYNNLGYTTKPCNEIDEHELSVIDPVIFLCPIHAPTAYTGHHRITVTLTDNNGEAHSQTVETDFSYK